MSDDSIVEARPETGRGRKGSTVAAAAVAAAAAAAAEKPQPTAPRKLTKRARSPRKWNLFGRSHSQPASVKPALQSTSTVAVTVEAAAVPAEKNKPVAFYAMFDSSEQEDGDMDMMDVEDVLREARVLDSPVVPSSKPRDRRPSIEQTVFGYISSSRHRLSNRLRNSNTALGWSHRISITISTISIIGINNPVIVITASNSIKNGSTKMGNRVLG
ncbi:hypothetical protein SCUCBS95973_000151 [Sporothrix curviconia]|uniref:Uncharacterized protein n=1 Tax=Sporothrix curviconia TaxID=1260050 RepID=A0ABP0AMV2_9PEZI